ncbi:MAG: hypothetical protein DRQ78_03915 [Epsilonproteobacteria bacterium]|nr:MAG: hypothetical protein DRQ78_03915 [Campylobacterota bacterium]
MTKAQEHRKKFRIAKRIIRSSRNTSTSYLQRMMEIGYNYVDILMEDLSRQRGFGFVYRSRRKLLGRSFRKNGKYFTDSPGGIIPQNSFMGFSLECNNLKY